MAVSISLLFFAFLGAAFAEVAPIFVLKIFLNQINNNGNTPFLESPNSPAGGYELVHLPDLIISNSQKYLAFESFPSFLTPTLNSFPL